MLETLYNYVLDSGFGQFHWSNGVMILVGLTFIYLAVKKGFEPLLLVPIGFGILIGNIPYPADKLPLSVYDGPVSEHDLTYYRIDIEKGELDRKIDLVDPLTLKSEQSGTSITLSQYKRHHLGTRLREELAVNGGSAEDPQKGPWAVVWKRHLNTDWDRPQVAEEDIDRLADAVFNHDALMDFIHSTQTVRFSSKPELIENHEQGKSLVYAGEAVMVNTHSMFAARGDVEVPTIATYGQGRRIFVLEQRGDGRYPELWSMKKQDPHRASVLWYIFAGVGVAGFFPPLIFLGIGALTDFGPMLSNPKTLLLGAAAQFGIFGALLGALALGAAFPEAVGFDLKDAASIGIIGGADGPTAIFTCSQLAPDLLGAVALAAYSYMALVPIIQPPIIRLLTTKKERLIRMQQTKPVSRKVKIIFPIIGFLLTAFICPGGLPLLGMLFFGNLLRECMVTERLAKTAQTALIDIVTILLGISVGAKTSAANFLTMQTIGVFVLGVLAFGVATTTGVLFGKIMNWMTKEPINPMIGAAGVSAVPMAARVVHKLGQEEDPQNFLIMHAMGPNVAGVIGSAVAAGVLLSKLVGS